MSSVVYPATGGVTSINGLSGKVILTSELGGIFVDPAVPGSNVVQTAAKASATSNPTLAYSSSVHKGNLLVVVYSSNNGSPFGSVAISDTLGNSWTQDGLLATGSAGQYLIYHAVAKSSGANTVSLTCANGGELGIFEVSMFGSSSPIVTSSTGTAVSGTTLTVSPSLAIPSTPSFVVLILCGNATAIYSSPPTGFTLQTGIGAYAYGTDSSGIVSPSNGSSTSNTSQAWTAAIFAYGGSTGSQIALDTAAN